MKLLPNLGMIWSLVLQVRTTPHNFFAPKILVFLWEAFLWKKSSHNLEDSTMYTDCFEMIVHNYNKISIMIPNNFA